MAAIPLRRLVLVPLLGLALPLTVHAADEPPLPTELRLYGSVAVAGNNLDPVAQHVLALVNGRVCGAATTFLNPPGEPVDGGLTVYVIEVAASGTRPNEIDGCGDAGDAVSLYFPDSGRLAPGTVAFAAGAARFDVSLPAEPLANSLFVPLIANDAPR